MDAQWVASSTVLPFEGQAINFLLEDRAIALEGTYAGQTFRSRWTGYDVDRVRTIDRKPLEAAEVVDLVLHDRTAGRAAPALVLGVGLRCVVLLREEVLRRLVSPCEKDAIATHTNNQITKK